jgi:hypothetical protein
MHADRIKGYEAVAATKPEAWRYRSNYFQQFWTLLKRNLTVAYRDPTLYILLMGLHSFYGGLAEGREGADHEEIGSDRL